jgi:hypothetical protein
VPLQIGTCPVVAPFCPICVHWMTNDDAGAVWVTTESTVTGLDEVGTSQVSVQPFPNCNCQVTA